MEPFFRLHFFIGYFTLPYINETKIPATIAMTNNITMILETIVLVLRFIFYSLLFLLSMARPDASFVRAEKESYQSAVTLRSGSGFPNLY